MPTVEIHFGDELLQHVALEPATNPNIETESTPTTYPILSRSVEVSGINMSKDEENADANSPFDYDVIFLAFCKAHLHVNM